MMMALMALLYMMMGRKSHPVSAIARGGMRLLPSTSMVVGGTGNAMIGGDRDRYGCLTAAGYSWNPVLGKCARPWESTFPLTTHLIDHTEPVRYVGPILPM